MKKICILILIVLGVKFNAQSQQTYDLTGNIQFNVSSQNGGVERIAITVGNGGTGQFKAIMTNDASLPTHTLYLPEDLSGFGTKNKLPIVVYGNGGCRNGSMEVRNFLSEIASHGYLVVAVGPIKNSIFGVTQTESQASDPQLLIDGIDWAIKINNAQDSKFQGKINTNKIAVMGQSCGGLMAIGASKDKRVNTVVMLNSGLFPEPEESQDANPRRTGLPMTSKSYLKELKPSIAYFVGGETDMATVNADDDFLHITEVPAVVASYDFSDVKSDNAWGVGHYPATYLEDNGGDFAKATVAWLNWQLKDDNEAASIFEGHPCGLLENKKWSIKKKNID